MIKFSKIHNPDESPYYRIDEFNDKNSGKVEFHWKDNK